MNEILEGAILGFTLSFLIGPVFFTLLQTGIESGFRAGASYSAGVWLSDLLIILLIYHSMSAIATVVNSSQFVVYVGTIGAIILIGFGISSITSKVMVNLGSIADLKVSYLKLFGKGLLINTINPFTVIFWLGVNTLILSKEAFNSQKATLYFGSILTTLIATDLLKVLLARRIGVALKPIHIHRMRQIAGALLIISGMVMLYRVYIK
jgi:threonine/homoserine/homoserine lactone efflux protein